MGVEEKALDGVHEEPGEVVEEVMRSSPPAPRGSAPASAPPLPPWVRWLCLLGWVDFFLHNKVVVMLILYGLLVCFRVCRCTACTLVHSNFAKKFSLFVHLCELTLHIC